MDIKETLAAKAAEKPGVEIQKPAVAKPFEYKGTYTGEYGIFGSNGLKIPRVGNEYQPTCKDDIAVLEEQVARGFVFKE